MISILKSGKLKLNNSHLKIMETHDISLILLPSWGITEPPLTLASLASFLRAKDISVKVYDFNVELYHLLSKCRGWWNIAYGLDIWETPSLISKFWEENIIIFDYLIEKIAERKPKYVGFTLFVSTRYLTELFSQRLKNKYPEIKIIYGGPEVAYIDDLSEYSKINTCVDYFVMGEGEEALLNIIHGGESEKIINGLDFMKNLNDLPVLDLSDYNFRAYNDPFSFPMYSSRGCPNRCIYCTERIHMGRYRYRSAEKIFEDIKKQHNLYPFLRRFRFQESTNNGNPKELEKFADLMIQSNMNLKWALNNSVLRVEMNFPFFQKLNKAGCVFINFGLETPSHRILEFIGKKLAKNADFDKIVREAYESGIDVGLCIMFGLPSENEHDFQMQLKFLAKNYKYISIIAPSLWFCYFPKQSDGFKDPDKYNINLELGSLYWTSTNEDNNYLVRLERFVRYTNLARRLGVLCVFGYETLPNPMPLIEQYISELEKHGKTLPSNLDEYKKRILGYISQNNYKRKSSILMRIIRKFPNKIIMNLPKMRFEAKIEKKLEVILNTILNNGISLEKLRKRKIKKYTSYKNYLNTLNRRNLINIESISKRENLLQKFLFLILNKFSSITLNEIQNHSYRIHILEDTISKILNFPEQLT